MAAVGNLFDTNAIIEAHRTSCWGGLIGQHRIETVEQCIVEIQSGGEHISGYVAIDGKVLRKQIRVNSVNDGALVRLHCQLQMAADLDEGEKHLLAYVLTQGSEWRICSPDKASIRALVALKKHDQLISLEELANEAGLRPKLKSQYQKKWLERKRTEYLLGIN